MKSFLDFKFLLEDAKLQTDHAIVGFGRFQGPTRGHQAIIDHIKELAEKHGADHFVYTSNTGPTHKVRSMREKNPLTPHEKVGFMKKFFPDTNIQAHPEVLSPYHALEHLHSKGYKKITMVTGPDPGDQSQEEFAKGLHAHAKTLGVHLEMSGPKKRVAGKGGVQYKGSVQRELAKTGSYANFAKTLPSGADKETGMALRAALKRPIPEPEKKPKKKKLKESILTILAEARKRTAREKTRAFYAKEYKKYQGTPKAIKERSKRVMARRKMIKAGRASIGDGKDVDHKRSLSSGGSNNTSNLRVMSRSKNRGRNNNK